MKAFAKWSFAWMDSSVNAEWELLKPFRKSSWKALLEMHFGHMWWRRGCLLHRGIFKSQNADWNTTFPSLLLWGEEKELFEMVEEVKFGEYCWRGGLLNASLTTFRFVPGKVSNSMKRNFEGKLASNLITAPNFGFSCEINFHLYSYLLQFLVSIRIVPPLANKSLINWNLFVEF